MSELRPSPVEQYGEKDDWLIVRARYTKKKKKKSINIISEKMFCLFSEKINRVNKINKVSNRLIKESRMLIYDEKKNKIQIGNEVEAEGKLSFFETARNPGILIRKPIIKGRIFTEKYGVKL